jgi:hypothetical protein
MYVHYIGARPKWFIFFPHPHRTSRAPLWRPLVYSTDAGSRHDNKWGRICAVSLFERKEACACSTTL